MIEEKNAGEKQLLNSGTEKSKTLGYEVAQHTVFVSIYRTPLKLLCVAICDQRNRNQSADMIVTRTMLKANIKSLS
jgi:hypothetical protein